MLFPFALLINEFINLLFANKLITNYSVRTKTYFFFPGAARC
ncbi:hypothetical protein CSC17_5273 [Klebsiella oxytoca]|nr:hypothetical protein CSC17_5273 [Klebsiella oxytoca]